MTKPAAPRKLMVPLGLFLGVFLVYALSMPVRIEDNYDAVAEVHAAVEGGGEWRPNHLMLTPVYRLALDAADTVGFPGPPFIRLQLVTALFGAISALLMFVLLRLHACRRRDSSLAALLLAFSHVHWLHSREAESAMIAQALLMAALCMVSRVRGCGRAAGLWLAVGGGAAIAASVLMATNIALFIPAVALLLWVTAERASRHRATLVFLATSALCALLPFLVAFMSVSETSTPSGFLAWLTQHSSTTRLGDAAGSFSPANLLRAGSGIVNSFSGYTSVTSAIKLAMKGQAAIPIPMLDWFRFIFGVVVTLFLAAHYLRPTRPASRLLMLLVLATVVPFTVLWLGSEPQFWLPVLPFFLLHPATVLSRATASRTLVGCWAVAVAALFAFNLSYPVPTLIDPHGGPDWRRAEQYHELTEPGDLLIYSAGWGKHLRAFGPHHPIDLVYFIDESGDEFIDAITARVDDTLARGGRVYALEVFSVGSSEAIGRWEKVENQTGLTRADIVGRLSARYHTEPVNLDRFENALWEMTPASP